MLKKTMILLTSALLITACSPSQSEPESFVEEGRYLNDLVSKDDFENLSFDNQVYLVHLKEEIDSSLPISDLPVNNLASQDSYITEDNGLHLFYNAELPKEDTKYIVVKEVFDNGILLDYSLNYYKENLEPVKIESIDHYTIYDDKRAFLNKEVNLSFDEENLNVSLGNDTFTVENGKSKEIEDEVNEAKTKITISNFGSISTKEDITFDSINDENLAEEFKRNSLE